MTNDIQNASGNIQSYENIITDLITGRVIPGPLWQKHSYRLKFLLRTILFYSPTLNMLNNLSARPDFNQLLYAQVTLPSKVHRQYLTRKLNAKERAQAIIDHYQFIDSLPARFLISAMTSAHSVPLLQLHGKDDTCFTLSVSAAGKSEREGETTIWLHDDKQTLLASATFSVIRQDEQWQLIIGGLQGPRRHVPHETIKLATRACYGLFPKRLLVEFIWAFANKSHIQSIYGVSDNGHIYRALRYRFSKGRHFHASYDEFWHAINSVADGPWRWRLPLQSSRKPLDMIASKKRAEYRRRFQLLDDLITQVNHHFACR
ncbi:VirK/YbjX family protein [Enterobacteriaceae bacterium ESL0689]|nr:VirK/YbjX family protein [Enterobacteriaceae bacterium ESL0689]